MGLDTEQVTRVYAAYSRFYDFLFGRIFHDGRAQAVKTLRLKPGEEVLEVGVGTGLSLPFYPRYCRIIGIDLCAEMLRRGYQRIYRQSLNHVRLEEMDATRMSFPDNRFDAVVAAYVMTAVPDPRQALREMVRVCRPGGRIVLLSHFRNGHPFLSRIEKTISPLCVKLGFRTDVELERLLEGSPVRVAQRARVKPLNYWNLVLCVNEK